MGNTNICWNFIFIYGSLSDQILDKVFGCVELSFFLSCRISNTNIRVPRNTYFAEKSGGLFTTWNIFQNSFNSMQSHEYDMNMKLRRSVKVSFLNERKYRPKKNSRTFNFWILRVKFGYGRGFVTSNTYLPRNLSF